MTAFISRSDSDNLSISGDLVFATVQDLLKQGQNLVAGQADLTIDLAEVNHTDSSGLALMLEWIGGHRSDGLNIYFRNVPESLLEIARVSNLVEFLPLVDN